MFFVHLLLTKRQLVQIEAKLLDINRSAITPMDRERTHLYKQICNFLHMSCGSYRIDENILRIQDWCQYRRVCRDACSMEKIPSPSSHSNVSKVQSKLGNLYLRILVFVHSMYCHHIRYRPIASPDRFVSNSIEISLRNHTKKSK